MATIDYKQKIKDYMNSSEVDTLYKSMLNNLFPELKESDDEKIRKAIYNCVKWFGFDSCFFKDVSQEECLAWLKKQCEHANFRNKIQIGDKVTRNEDGVLVNLSQLNRVAKKQGEQKPAVIIPKFKIGDEIKTSNEKSLTITKIDEKGYWSEDLFICDFDEECLWDLVEQNPAWSDEDERNLDWLITVCERIHYKSDPQVSTESALMLRDWLKSLKERYTWKPSDEQMAVLNEVINYAANSELQHWNSFIYTLLKSLREQLKKLREE